MRFSFLILAFCIVFSSCKKDNPGNNEPGQTTKNFVFSTGITSGINIANDAILTEINSEISINLASPVEIDPVLKNGLKRIKRINALTDQIVSDICYLDKYVYVSYFAPGTRYLGTVDVYSIEDIDKISRIARFSFSDTDVLGISCTLGRMFLVCSSADRPLFMEEIIYNPTVDIDPMLNQYLDIPASSFKTIVVTSENVYVLAESDESSGVYIYDTNADKKEQKHFVSLSDPLSMVQAGESNAVYVLQNGSPAKAVKVSNSGTTSNNISLGGINAQSYNTGIAADNQLYVHAGNEALIYDNTTLKQSFGWTEESGGTQPSYMSRKNVVLMGRWLLIMGNNGKGARLCGLRNNENGDVSDVYDLVGIGESLSLMDANDDFVVIANQDGTLQFLWKYSVGMPEINVYERDVAEWEEKVTTLFPSKGDNKDKFEDLFEESGADPVLNITVTKDTELYVSVVSYSADFPNTLGYYLYDESKQNVADIEYIPIFPNIKSTISVGNMVKLCDADGNVITFKKDQEIGFYFIPNGWDPDMNNGYGGINTSPPRQIFHTHLLFNGGNAQSHVLYRVAGQNNSLFMGFEDDADSDYEDVIISISDNDDNAAISKINFSNITELTLN